MTHKILQKKLNIERENRDKKENRFRFLLKNVLEALSFNTINDIASSW